MSMDLLERLIAAGTPAALVAEVAMVIARAESAQSILNERRSRDRSRKASVPRISAEIQGSRGIPRQSAEFQADPPSPKESPHTPKELTPSPSLASLGSYRAREAMFERFYSAFPRRVARKAAETKFWLAVKAGADPEAIIAGAQLYAMACRTVELQFVKHPATWLNQGCWEDEHLPTPPARAGPLTRTDTLAEIQREAALRILDEQSGDPPNPTGEANPAESRNGHAFGELSQPLDVGTSRPSLDLFPRRTERS